MFSRCEKWLSFPEYWTNNHMARKHLQDGTARWFLEGNVFEDWKKTGTLLWINGKRMLFVIFVPFYF
jgi:hypothetical protein